MIYFIKLLLTLVKLYKNDICKNNICNNVIIIYYIMDFKDLLAKLNQICMQNNQTNVQTNFKTLLQDYDIDKFIYFLASRNNYNILKLLINNGYNPNVKYSGISSLYAACSRGNKEVVQIILGYGVDKRDIDDSIHTSFESCIEDIPKILVDYALEKWPNYELNSSMFTKCFFTNIYYNNLENVKLLLDCNINPNIIYRSQRPLEFAIYTSNIELTRLLLRYNTNINLPNSCGKMVAEILIDKVFDDYKMMDCEYKDLEIFSLLVQHGIKLYNCKNKLSTFLKIIPPKDTKQITNNIIKYYKSNSLLTLVCIFRICGRYFMPLEMVHNIKKWVIFIRLELPVF